MLFCTGSFTLEKRTCNKEPNDIHVQCFSTTVIIISTNLKQLLLLHFTGGSSCANSGKGALNTPV